MIIPVRCFSCGKPIGHLWEKYEKLQEEGEMTVEKILTYLGLRRMCCRRMLLTHIDLLDRILEHDDTIQAI